MAQTINALRPGDPVPFFRQRSAGNPDFVFDTAAGRYLVLCFFGSAGDAHARAALNAVASRPAFFNDDQACFFGVSIDPDDERTKRVANRLPGYRFFWDFDLTICRLYGSVPPDADPEIRPQMRRQWVIVDPMLRIVEQIPFAPDRSDIDALLKTIDTLPPKDRFAGFEVYAPIIVLPNVFESEMCTKLIDHYVRHGGSDSGFMRDIDGKTVGVNDHRHKRRRDCLIEDRNLIDTIQRRFLRRVLPEVKKIHMFHATRMERYLVACYSAEEGGHFNPHRDNTTRGTAHRRFAVSINLNDDFDGGELSFPEYGSRRYKMAAGGAVVFSCALLHAVSTVTRGNRFAFLPFLYDDAAARLREENRKYVDPTVGHNACGTEKPDEMTA